ncbi:hypothetical protein [Shewanella marisflavi]|uniref:hypothetical protein n=1 Tax=Shewanella marisflavi TaxID=260364 RepID=UPI003AAB84D1
MKLINGLLGMALGLFVIPAMAIDDEFVEVIVEDQTALIADPAELLEPDVGPKRFDLTQGLVKANIERLTAEQSPEYTVVWSTTKKALQYADHQIFGADYDDLLEQIVSQYGLGACIRANDVVEIYDIKANRYYCED